MESLCLKRHLHVPLSRVFAAWSQAELMERWFFPGDMTCEVSNDFRVGGKYHIVMKGAEGDYPHHGEYREIQFERKIVFTWSSPVVSNTLVTLEFEGDEVETQLTLTHTLFSDVEIRDKHQSGWTGCLNNLEAAMRSESEE